MEIQEENAKGEKNDPVLAPPKKKRRAGELSGRQIALQKCERDGKKTFNIKMPPMPEICSGKCLPHLVEGMRMASQEKKWQRCESTLPLGLG